MPFLNLPDFRMYYEEYGSGTETIVAVHGNMASIRWWRFLIPYLPANYRLIAMDLRGCGKSTHPEKGHEIGQFVEDIDALVRVLHLNSFHLIGHSMGGQTAMAYTLAYQDKVDTLTLVDSVPADGLVLGEEERQAFKTLMADQDLLRLAIGSCCPYFNEGEVIDQFLEDALSSSQEIFLGNPETMHATNFLDRLEEIKVPVLIIHGREDSIIPVPSLLNTIKAMAGARVVLLEKCGHSPFIERTEIAARVFFGFLNDCNELKAYKN